MTPTETHAPLHDAFAGKTYGQLLRLARRYMARRGQGDTLQPTALVHEAWLKLARGDAPPVADGEHVLALLARAMRQVLVNHAVSRRTRKREALGERVPLDGALSYYERSALDLVALDEALERLRSVDPRQAAIVDLRFFGTMTTARIAEVLAVSMRTVEREWRVARAWLRTEIEAG